MKFIKFIVLFSFVFFFSCKEEREEIIIPVQSNDGATLILFTTKPQNVVVYIDENLVGEILDSSQDDDCETEGLKPGGYDVYYEGTYTSEIEGEEDLNFESSYFIEVGVNECKSVDITFGLDECLNCRTIKQ